MMQGATSEASSSIWWADSSLLSIESEESQAGIEYGQMWVESNWTVEMIGDFLLEVAQHFFFLKSWTSMEHSY